MSADKAHAERIRRHMRKLHAIANDERGNPHIRDQARQKLEWLSKKHGVSISEIEQEPDLDYSRFNIKVVQLSYKRVPIELRMACLLVSQHFQCEIKGGKFERDGVLRLRFVVKKPGSAEEPSEAFSHLIKFFQMQWKAFSTEKTLLDKIMSFGMNPHRKSFMSGIYHGLANRFAPRQPEPEAEALPTSAESLPEPSEPTPFTPPPNNPLALICLPKKARPEPKPNKLKTKSRGEKKKKKPDPEQETKLDPEFDLISFNCGFKRAKLYDYDAKIQCRRSAACG